MPLWKARPRADNGSRSGTNVSRHKMIFLKDKIAVVTGAGSGLGQAIAELFARAGASVWVADVDARGGAETVARITAANGRGSFLKLDVTREEDFHAAVQAIPAADIV